MASSLVRYSRRSAAPASSAMPQRASTSRRIGCRPASRWKGLPWVHSAPSYRPWPARAARSRRRPPGPGRAARRAGGPAGGEEVTAAHLGRDVPVAHVGAQRRRAVLLGAARRAAGEKSTLGLGGDQVAHARLLADAQAVDLLQNSREPSGDRTTAGPVAAGAPGIGAVLLPGVAVRLPRHVGQGKRPSSGRSVTSYTGDVVRPLALAVEDAGGVEVAVGRRV